LIEWAWWLLTGLKKIVTRIVSGLEAFQGLRRETVNPYQWFFRYHHNLTVGLVAIYASDILATGSIIHLVYLYAGPRFPANRMNVTVNIGMVASPNPTIGEMNDSEAIVPFTPGILASVLELSGNDFTADWPCRKVIQGTNQRIGIMFTGWMVTADMVRAGVLYEEP